MNKFYITGRSQLILLALCWLLMQGLVLWKFGIVTGFEAIKYIHQAELFLASGTYESGNFLFYSTQILLISFCLKWKIGFWGIVLFQFIVSGLAHYIFYKLCTRLAGKVPAFFGTLGLIIMFYFQLYNTHLFTESLFFSFSIIYCFGLFSIQRLTITSILCLLAGLALLVFTRPTGLLFIPPTVLFLLIKFIKRKAWVYIAGCMAIGLSGFYFLLNKALGSGGEFDFLLPYVEEHIICGIPTASIPNEISVNGNQNSVAGLRQVIKEHSDLFARLAAQRFLSFWGVIRPYYSLPHNIFIAAYFYTLYAFIVFGLRNMIKRYLAETVFLITYILLMLTTVMLSCDEWHNRFIFSILPFLIILSLGHFAKDKHNGVFTRAL